MHKLQHNKTRIIITAIFLTVVISLITVFAYSTYHPVNNVFDEITKSRKGRTECSLYNIPTTASMQLEHHFVMNLFGDYIKNDGIRYMTESELSGKSRIKYNENLIVHFDFSGSDDSRDFLLSGSVQTNPHDDHSLFFDYEYIFKEKTLYCYISTYKGSDALMPTYQKEAYSKHGLAEEQAKEYQQYFLYEIFLTDWCRYNSSEFSLDNLGDVEIVYEVPQKRF